MKRAVSALVVLLGLSGQSWALNLEQKAFDLGLSAAVLGTGTVEAAWHSDFQPDETLSIGSSPSPLVRATADYYVIPNLALGAALNYAAFIPSADIEYYDDGLHHINKNDINTLDYCFALKGRFIVSERVAVKPGIYIGGRSSFSGTPEAREMGVALNGSLEIQIYLSEATCVLFDTGFLSQPYGGVEGVAYVRGGPIYYIGVGLGI